MRTRVLFLAWVVCVAVLPGTAEAACVRGTEICVCGHGVPDVIVEGSVASVSDSVAELNVEVAHTGEAPTSPVSFEASGLEKVGDRMLLHLLGGEVTLRQRLNADGTVNCGKYGVTMTSAQAVQVALRTDCAEVLPDYGFREVPCDDVSGCQTVAGAAGTAGALLMLAAGWVLAQVRRPARPR